MFKIITIGVAAFFALFISPWIPVIGLALLVGHSADQKALPSGR